MRKINIFLDFYYILLFILKEIKNFFLDFKRIFTIHLRYYNIFKLILFKRNKNINPSCNKIFINFINENKKLWDKNKKIDKKIDKKKNKKKILITAFVHHHAGYPYINSIIGKYLEEYHDIELIGFCDSHDYTSQIIIRSFGIKKFYYLFERNFFVRFFYFLSALINLKKINDVDEFLKFKYNDIDIGKITYDDVLRRSGIASFNKFSFKLVYHFAEAMNKSDQYKKILSKIDVVSTIQSEHQFIPSAIIFQQTLKNKIKVYSRNGHGTRMSIRKFSSFSKRYTFTTDETEKLFKFIYKERRHLASKLGYKLIKKRLSGNWKAYFEIERIGGHGNKKNYSKKELCKILNWDINKPIVAIFSHSLIDGNYRNGPRIFKDNLTWLRETLFNIQDIDKFNWMIKPHPNDGYYNFAKTNTIKEYNEIVGKYDHVKIVPNDLSSISVSKIVNAIVTSHGTASLEYACMGLPAITAGRTAYSYLNINYWAKTKKKYFYYLNNIDKLNRPSKIQLDKARTHAYIDEIVIKINNNLIPNYDTTSKFNENKFYQDCNKLIMKYSHNSDKFKEMVFNQFKNNSPQSVDLNIMQKVLKIKKNKYDIQKI